MLNVKNRSNLSRLQVLHHVQCKESSKGPILRAHQILMQILLKSNNTVLKQIYNSFRILNIKMCNLTLKGEDKNQYKTANFCREQRWKVLPDEMVFSKTWSSWAADSVFITTIFFFSLFLFKMRKLVEKVENSVEIKRNGRFSSSIVSELAEKDGWKTAACSR